VAVTVEVARPDPIAATGPVVGVDRGIKTFAVCSEGCGPMIDRDLNAARDLARLAGLKPGSSPPVRRRRETPVERGALAGLLPVRWNCPR
jgi:transposase